MHEPQKQLAVRILQAADNSATDFRTQRSQLLVCIHARVCVCVCVYVYIYIYIYIYTHIHISIYVHTQIV